ncbi:MAG: hypothetical protein D6692_00435 [Planctomycetota bacterium]|nr:MAG: hypothetical protein D6692_00435 [Planctomycetota bacterium]
MLIKILDERLNGYVRKVDGASGKLYKFTWSPDHKAYVYRANSQEEAEDFFTRENTYTKFAPVFAPSTEDTGPDVGNGKENTAAAGVEEDQTQREVLSAMLKGVGVAVQESDSLDVLERLLLAYDRGRAEGQSQAAEADAKAADSAIAADAPKSGRRGRRKKVEST